MDHQIAQLMDSFPRKFHLSADPGKVFSGRISNIGPILDPTLRTAKVRIEVRNAQFDVRQNRVSVQAAQSAVDLARQTLDADQQKLKVGLTTQTAILQDAATLTTGESNLVSAKAAYEKSRIELDRATGLLLDHSGIDVADATRGQVTHLPSVPYIAPRQDAEPGVLPSSAPQPPGQM